MSARSSISIYQPSDEKAVNHVQTMSNIYKLAQEKAPGAPLLLPLRTSRSLLYMYPNESRTGVQLIVIIMNGVRLYFSPSTSAYSFSYAPSGNVRPLQLIHVRLLPPQSIAPRRTIKSAPSALIQWLYTKLTATASVPPLHCVRTRKLVLFGWINGFSPAR